MFPGSPPISIKSKTQRMGDKFVNTQSWPSKQSYRKVTIENTDTLEVSTDGKTLTEIRSFASEGNTNRLVYLYERLGGSATKDINGEWIQKKGNRLISLIVEHNDPEIKVTRRVVSEAPDETETCVYYTDGRREIHVKDGKSVKSVTKWKDQRLLFSSPTKTNFEGDNLEFSESIGWEIASDGASLIEVTESRISSSIGFISGIPGPVTLIYARSSKRFPE
jgi:hypothetical protein